MSEGKPSKTENNVEQKHMFSPWEKCVQEVEENEDDPRFKLEFDINGNLLAPNGQISEYNKYRQKDNEGKYIKPENENNNPALLLAKVVRSKTFIDGDDEEWLGFGDWRIDKQKISLQKINSLSREPIIYLHGTKKTIPSTEGLSPKVSFDRSMPEIWFSTKMHVAGSYAFDVVTRRRNVIYPNFLRITEVMTMYSVDTGQSYPSGTARLSPNHETAVLYNTSDIFHIPPNLLPII